MRKFVYRVEGEPPRAFLSPLTKRYEAADYRVQRIKWIVTIENQHEERDLSKPIELEAYFYQNKKVHDHPLSLLMRFVEEQGRDRLFEHPKCIRSYTGKRLKVKDDPHTILVVKEIE